MKACVLIILFLLSSYQSVRSEMAFATDAGMLQVRMLTKIRTWSLKKAKEYYPEEQDGGEPGDAYRHVLASVVSRKLVGRSVASSAGWVNEMLRDIQGSNTPRDRFMDLHNNKVGRLAQYHLLKANNLDSIAVKVRDFIDDEANGKLFSWGQEAPTRKEALAKHKSAELTQLYFIYE